MISIQKIAEKFLIIVAVWVSCTYGALAKPNRNLLELWQQGEYLELINILILELEVNQTQYDEKKIADIKVYLAASYAELGRYVEARANLESAIAIYREIGEKLKLAAALTDLNHLNLMLGKSEIALEQSKSALEVLQTV